MSPDGTYIRVSDHLPEHPKISAVGGEAGWLYVAGLCYCSRNLTDGFIPATVVGRLTDLRRPNVLSGRLVDAGLWHQPGHACPACPPAAAGFVVHGYLAYQRSAAQVADIKVKRAAAGRRGGQAKARAGQPDSTVTPAGLDGEAGTVPAGWHNGDTGRSVATGTPQAEADVCVPPVRQTPMPAAEGSPAPVSRRARAPGTDDTGVLDVDGLVDRIGRLRPDWPPGRIRAALAHPDVLAHPAEVVTAAAVLLATDPQTRHPGRLRHPGPWWERATADTPGRPDPPATHTLTRPPFDPQANARGRAAVRHALDTRTGCDQAADAGSSPDPGHRDTGSNASP